MTNKEIVAVLNEIGTLLDLSGESPFKARAYTNVARQIERLEEDVSLLGAENRLREIKGVGDALEKKLLELVDTGALEYHRKLRAKFPPTLFDLFGISGLGAKRIKVLYDDLGIDSLDGLETVCRDGRLSELKGFGPKMRQKLLDGIAFAREHEELYHFDDASAEADVLRRHLRKENCVVRIATAGSLRRCMEVVKDIDIVASSTDPGAVMRRFVESGMVARVTGHGETKSSVILKSGIAADLRVVTDEEYPYALAHFTGSKEHNVAMRQRAKERGLKLNEYGLFDGDKKVQCEDEAEIFGALELGYIPPELREDRGEFDTATLPTLVKQRDLIGVYHCHSTYSDGQNTVEEMAVAAMEAGYQYLTITDHSQSAAYAGGLTPDRVAAQQDEVDGLNEFFGEFAVLKGIESDIRRDGSLDYDEDILETFDLVIASVHSKLDMAEDEATDRVIKAVENPYTTILGHPTGRLLLGRKGYPLDFEKVFDACRANNVAIEINGNCRRLDLDWRHVHRAKEKGLKLCIGPDAHNVDGLGNIAFGLGIARKGWLEKDDLLNCMTLEQFRDWRLGT